MRAETLCSISLRLHFQPQKQAHQWEIKIGGGHCDCAEAELYLDVSGADSDLRKINEGVLHHTGYLLFIRLRGISVSLEFKGLTFMFCRV